VLTISAGLEQTVGGRPLRLDVRLRNAANARYADFLSRYKAFAYGAGRNLALRLSIGD
jgi:hypothetical protein